MGKRVLVPVDGSDQAHEACDFVVAEYPDAEMVLLHVINPAEAGYSAQASIPSFSEEWYEQAQANAETLFDEL
jgi:nucleotide-binding universal stress UspA family protein